MSIFLSPNSNIICREILQKPPQQQLKSYGFILNIDWGRRKFGWKTRSKRDVKANSASSLDFSRPDALEMQPIVDCDHLDNILSEAQLLSQPIIIDWMASWCRKCIYLKPKLEKLAAEYDTKLKIFYVDVNNVSQELVKRGNISKMPTIQLWKDGEMKEEVIGGHKGWIVIEEIKEMIHKYINDADVLNSM